MMKIQYTKIVKTLCAFSLIGILASCATTKSIVGDKTLLDFIEDGKTTKEMVILKLGQPSGKYEQERILTYMIVEDEEGKRIVGIQKHLWFDIKYSVVLIFDDNGVLEKHSLVPVR